MKEPTKDKDYYLSQRRKRNSPPRDWNTPYYIQMRDAERRIYREALEVCDGDMAQACGALGISETYFLQRAHRLGGVLPNEPRIEPSSVRSAVRSAVRSGAENRHASRSNHDPSPEDIDPDQDLSSDGDA